MYRSPNRTKQNRIRILRRGQRFLRQRRSRRINRGLALVSQSVPSLILSLVYYSHHPGDDPAD